MSKLRLLSKLRRFNSGDDVDKYLSTEFRQSLKAIEDALRDDPVTATETTTTEIINYVASVGNDNFSDGSGSYVDIPDMTLQITTDGRPVHLFIGARSSGSAFFTEFGLSVLTVGSSQYRLFRDTTKIWDTTAGPYRFNTFNHFDDNDGAGLPAGTYTYKMQLRGNGGGTAFIRNAKLVAVLV